jgi:RNA-directed DNA polymerase
MINTPISLQDLRRSLYAKAKAEPAWRFWGLYVQVCKMETLYESLPNGERKRVGTGH